MGAALAPPENARQNQNSPVLTWSDPTEGSVGVTLDAGFPLVAYVAKQSYIELGLASGAEVVASKNATAIHLIDR